MLLSAIDKDMFEKVNIGKMFLDQLGNMFGYMLGGVGPDHELDAGQSREDYSHENVMFEHQSRIGRAKGEMASPDPMKKQIDQFYEAKKNMEDGRGVVVLDGSDEENTLG